MAKISNNGVKNQEYYISQLENKLKQVRDKKKKKAVDRIEPNNGNGFVTEPIRCDLLPKNIEMKLKGNGMVALGEVDFFLKLGNMGNMFSITYINNKINICHVFI